MRTDVMSRRGFLALAGAGTLSAMTFPALALTQREAEQLINKVVDEVNAVINSGKSEEAMYRDFERIFRKYADVDIIAASSLGVARRKATPAQVRAFTDAFTHYISRKYGKRFREFIGSEIKVRRSTKTKRGWLVTSEVKLKGREPFAVDWQVSDASGRPKMFDLIIEGISLLRTEREEIGQMLDARRGDLDRLIADLRAYK